MPISRLVISGTVVGGALFVWWFVAGSRLMGLVDRMTTMADGMSMAPAEFTFDEANAATFEPAALSFSTRRRIVPSDWRVVEEPVGRVTLETSRGRIVLGLITRRSTTGSGQHAYTFVPEPGDSVSLSRRRSRLSWPRPFVVSWLGGRLPFWSRYVYDRLVWRKSDGATLDAVWRDEQRLNPGDGWMDQYNSTPPAAVVRAPKH
jgi:hypothetical protein